MSGSGATPVYGFPYYALDDAPDIPDATSALALAVETRAVALANADTALGVRVAVLEVAKPYARLRRAATVNIANDVATEVMLFDTEDEDTHNGHDIVTNTDRYTVPLDGTYELMGGAGFVVNGTGRRGCWFTKNGTIINGSGAMVPATASGPVIVTARTTRIACVAGDILRLIVYQSSGGVLQTSGTTFEQPTLDIKYLHA